MTDRVTLITAASRGMGAACARQLAERGDRLVLLARSPEVEELAAGIGALAVRGSVDDPDALRRLVETALTRHGRIDAVVANTGHAAKGDLLELTDREWHEGFDLLLMLAIRLSRLAVPSMLERGAGAFVNISSFSAIEPGLRFPVSAVARAGLGAFAKLFAQRFGAHGLRMNNVLPGWIDTYPVEAAEVERIPGGRPGSADEVARVVAFLASDDASYVNGESLLVDGGLVRAI